MLLCVYFLTLITADVLTYYLPFVLFHFFSYLLTQSVYVCCNPAFMAVKFNKGYIIIGRLRWGIAIPCLKTEFTKTAFILG